MTASGSDIAPSLYRIYKNYLFEWCVGLLCYGYFVVSYMLYGAFFERGHLTLVVKWMGPCRNFLEGFSAAWPLARPLAPGLVCPAGR